MTVSDTFGGACTWASGWAPQLGYDHLTGGLSQLHRVFCGLIERAARHPDCSLLEEVPLGYNSPMNTTVLWVIAAILVIIGVVQLIQGQIIFGILLIVAGCLVGPGGISIFNRR